MVQDNDQYLYFGPDHFCDLDGFFDTNSLMIHLELENEIDKLEKEKEFLKSEIAKDKEILEKMSDKKELEKLAREKYYMKKENEEIFLIEYEDSIKNQHHE